MAYVLVITLLAIAQTDGSPDYTTAIVQLVLQLVIGVAAGLGLGKLSLYLINKLKIDNSSLYPILVLTFSIFIFSFTYFIKGNGYLAVYIGGLVVGNHNFAHKRSSVRFFDGLAWLCQLIMFLTLGLLVNPHELVPVFGSGLIISVMMIFVARPASIFLCLIPFNDISFKEKLFVSWCGLRGAVPIIFAILPLSANVEHSHLFFNIVFFCTLISLLVQGTSLPLMARLLKLDIKGSDENVLKNFDVDFSDEIKSVTSEISLTEKALENGRLLMDLALPDKTLVVMIKRNNKFFVPTGKTELFADDKLLIITDDHTALRETYKSLGL
jgi:cell volume regulation protein A